MDDELLRELIRGQKEQTELLRKNLGRWRFSMRALLILMTVTACGLGYVAYVQRSNNVPSASGIIFSSPAPTGTVITNGTVNLRTTMPTYQGTPAQQEK